MSDPRERRRAGTAAQPYCTRRVGDLAPGAPCPDCGHTSVIHPMYSNPGVAHCGLCELEAALKRLR